MPSKVETSADTELRHLEATLDAAIEQARLAKQAVKAAKAEAKRAKKDRKRARRALIEAQERAGLRDQEADAAPQPSERDGENAKPQRRPTGERIAESPERRRAAPRKRSATPRRAKRGDADDETTSPVEPRANEPQADETNEANDTTKPAEG